MTCFSFLNAVTEHPTKATEAGKHFHRVKARECATSLLRSQQDLGAAGHTVSTVRMQRDQCSCAACSPLHSVGIPAHEIVPSTFKEGPSSQLTKSRNYLNDKSRVLPPR